MTNPPDKGKLPDRDRAEIHRKLAAHYLDQLTTNLRQCPMWARLALSHYLRLARIRVKDVLRRGLSHPR